MTDLARRRAAAQLHHRPAAIRHPADVVREAGPIQAQEPRAAKLAFRARSRRLTAADVDRARNEEASLLRAWLMRGTLHVIASEDARWLLPIYRAGMARITRERLAGFGVSAAGCGRIVADVRRWLADGPVPRAELLRRVIDRGLPSDAQTRYRLIALIVSEAGVCLGPDRGRGDSFVLDADWIGEHEPPPREDSLAELARRYLRGYGPASERDFARWAGLPLRDVRAGIERIAGELREVRVGDHSLVAPRRTGRRVAPSPQVRLLGGFDNYYLGYESRHFAIAPRDVNDVVPGGGVVNPTITVDGRFVGTWSSKRSGERLAVTLKPFSRIDPAWGGQLEAEVADIGRFEGSEATL